MKESTGYSDSREQVRLVTLAECGVSMEQVARAAHFGFVFEACKSVDDIPTLQMQVSPDSLAAKLEAALSDDLTLTEEEIREMMTDFAYHTLDLETDEESLHDHLRSLL